MAWNFVSAGDLTSDTSLVSESICLSSENAYYLPPALTLSDSSEHELQVFWAFETGRLCEVEPVTLVCLRDVVLLPGGIVITRDGDCVAESLQPLTPENYKSRFGEIEKKFDGLVSRQTLSTFDHVESLIHLREPGEAGYFHWMNSVLPRVVASGRVSSLSSVPLAIYPHTPFATPSLDFLGLQSRTLICNDSPLRVGRLWFFTPCVLRGNHFTRQPFYSKVLRHDLLSDQRQADQLIYLSRSDAGVRRVINEHEVINVVEKFGFRVATVGSMSFAEQADLFGRTRVLLSAHGAGLSNALFMRNGRVGELVSRSRLWPTFRCLSGRLDLQYAALICDFDRTQTAERTEGNEDIHVDTARLEELCDVLVSG